MSTQTPLQYPNARRYLSTRAWALRVETLDVMCELLRMRSAGITLAPEEILARIGAARSEPVSMPGVAMLGPRMTAEAVSASIEAARRSGSPVGMGAVAVIPLYGVIDQKVGSMSDISGGTSVDGFMKQFRQCLNDPGVAGIVIDGDSPGGNVSGVPEAAAEILASRGTKPIVSVANPMLASAGYYLACAADELVCMPSGEVGSIGVFCVHDDFSAQNEMIGYKPTYISFGAYKTELNPDAPLDPDALAYQQKQVDSMGQDFVRFVAKARAVSIDAVRSNFGQGRMLLAKDALAAKMIDRIDTLDATIARVARMARTSGVAGAAAVPVRSAADIPAGDVCLGCQGSGLKPERSMGDPQGQEPCEICAGTGRAPQSRSADHTDVGRDNSGQFHTQCACSSLCACALGGPDVCGPDCETCTAECACVVDTSAVNQATTDDLEDLDLSLAVRKRA